MTPEQQQHMIDLLDIFTSISWTISDNELRCVGCGEKSTIHEVSDIEHIKMYLQHSPGCPVGAAIALLDALESEQP